MKQSPYNQPLAPISLPFKSKPNNAKPPNVPKNSINLGFIKIYNPPQTNPASSAMTSAAKQSVRFRSSDPVETTINHITKKIDVLSKNLVNYTWNVQEALNEIPKDIKSLKSSANCTDSRVVTSKLNESHLQKDVSDQTLKTILDFKSERAQT